MFATTSIKVLMETGKRVVLKAKGAAALIVATGIGAAAIKAAEALGTQLGSGSRSITK
ncbi:MAG: hypothetical protein ACOCWR_05625 [Oceanidesulfovibrio sp.]